jgi:hypothetical protein
MKLYGLVSKGLDVKGGRASGMFPRLVFRGQQTTNRRDVERFLNSLPYNTQRNLKIALVYDSQEKDRFGRFLHVNRW